MKPRVWLLLGVLASAVACLYMFKILGPWEHHVDVESGKLKAQMGDLYPRWLGTRELLLNGRNPYGPEVSHEIQMAFYGHVIEQKYDAPGTNVVDEQRFVYPVYIVFFLAPTIHESFSTLQEQALGLYIALTALSVVLWLDVMRWRPPKVLTASIVLFALSSPQIVQGLRLRQLGVIVAFLLALSAWCIARNHLAIAGVVLAVSTIKPQMVILPLAWFLFWGLSHWPRRWPLLAGFGATLGTLIGFGNVILPGWLRYFVQGLVAYRKYFPTTSLLCLALGNLVGGAVSAVAIVSILALAWRNRRADARSPEFPWGLAACFIGVTLFLPLSAPFNQVLLLLPTLMVIRDWAFLSQIGRSIYVLITAWPWICEVFLLLHSPRLDSPSRIPLLPSAMVLFAPFIVFLLFVTGLSRNKKLHLPPADSPTVSA